MRPTLIAAVATCAIALAVPRPSTAAELIANGGFESGLAGWTVASQLGSDGAFQVQSGSSSPVNALPVPPPPNGTQAAMTDSQGPGSHVLYQDFVLAAPTASAVLSFRLYVNNLADQFATPPTLDFATPELNQQARVDILVAGGDPFSLALSDLLLNAFRTEVGDPLTSGYTLFSIDVTALLNAHVGETLRLRFAEVDNLFVFNFGVDDVRIAVGEVRRAPEAPSLLLVVAGLLGLALAGKPRGRAPAARSSTRA